MPTFRSNAPTQAGAFDRNGGVRRSGAVQALILGWIIADGELATPVPGETLNGLALRLMRDVTDPGWEPVVVQGVTTWARADPDNHVVESVIETPGFRVLTQVPGSHVSVVPEVGARVECTGHLISVGAYEFESFGLPDVSQGWRVLAVRPAGIDDVVADLEPVEFRSAT